MVLSGQKAAFAYPSVDADLGIAHGVTPAGLARAITAHPQAAAAYLVSPSYFGSVADVGACADVAHTAGIPLIADEAWGSTSASALLLASLDGARQTLVTGRDRISASREAADKMRARVRSAGRSAWSATTSGASPTSPPPIRCGYRSALGPAASPATRPDGA
ncbi:hypothetical protein [Streptomyces noursei]|uniref:hypothetical protein n=1 Tax=Streptomyces noursei TaxID=1971 RepID=UPI0030F215CA